jgi:hypothetical protein
MIFRHKSRNPPICRMHVEFESPTELMCSFCFSFLFFCRGFQGHATLRAFPGFILLHFGVHRTGIGLGGRFMRMVMTLRRTFSASDQNHADGKNQSDYNCFHNQQLIFQIENTHFRQRNRGDKTTDAIQAGAKTWSCGSGSHPQLFAQQPTTATIHRQRTEAAQMHQASLNLGNLRATSAALEQRYETLKIRRKKFSTLGFCPRR